ncbi:hypothetical protein QE152_g24823 [Popillia japonica]|uniref:Uncharacterized protein n=1 Tax=Popillia japonica TaxID=7064 RepID=A0AAW1K4N4_POPJA
MPSTKVVTLTLKGTDLNETTTNEELIFENDTTPTKPASSRKVAPLYTSKGTAIERELEVRLERNYVLKRNEEELPALRVIEQNLKIEEQQLKVAEQKVRLEIAQHELMLVKEKTNKKHKLLLYLSYKIAHTIKM